jgi:AcrR family transcriptional regulator
VTSATETNGRPLRVDAQRNRERLLRAAESVFAQKGSGVGVDEIAAEAGVGTGTFYRHFPTKDALIEAILIDRTRRLVADAQAYLAAADPGQALFEFLNHLVDESQVKRDLTDALAKRQLTDILEGEGLAVFEQLTAVTSELLQAAQAAGAVRSDITTADLIGLVLGPCLASDNPLTRSCSPQLMLSVVCDGLRPSPE